MNNHKKDPGFRMDLFPTNEYYSTNKLCCALVDKKKL